VVVIACGAMGQPVDYRIEFDPVLTLALVYYGRSVLTEEDLSGASK